MLYVYFSMLFHVNYFQVSKEDAASNFLVSREDFGKNVRLIMYFILLIQHEH